MSAEGLEADTHALRDSPAKALIAVAAEQDSDLLVVGSRGMSVANQVSHHAPCSVLIVRND